MILFALSFIQLMIITKSVNHGNHLEATLLKNSSIYKQIS